jgi:hypothetical protein
MARWQESSSTVCSFSLTNNNMLLHFWDCVCNCIKWRTPWPQLMFNDSFYLPSVGRILSEGRGHSKHESGLCNGSPDAATVPALQRLTSSNTREGSPEPTSEANFMYLVMNDVQNKSPMFRVVTETYEKLKKKWCCSRNRPWRPIQLWDV